VSKLSLFAKSKAATVCYAVLTSLLGATGLSASCMTDKVDAGCIHFAQRTGSGYDKYINGPASTQDWLASHLWRMETTAGWFDRNLGWYNGAWAYLDSYAIYNGRSSEPLADEHPEWILRDQNGNRLYIPWGCQNGTCPQYAADISNPDYREHWINTARGILAKGYKGLWIDDVNLVMQVGNGNGKMVAPIDRNTGRPMTTLAWEKYFADFMTQVRVAFPKAEILHNSLWSAGSGDPGTDPYIQQEIRAADYINRESGVSDGGLTGGNGYWSLRSLLRFFDAVHALGTNVDIQEFNFSGDYAPACYFLVSQGMDAFGNGAVIPGNWPANYDVSLGNPEGSRYEWNGLLRRDFENGIVLVNPPAQPTVTVKLGSGYTNTSGKSVSSASIPGKQGLILLKSMQAPAIAMQPLPNGNYTVKNLYSSLVLDDSGYSTVPGKQIIQWASNGGKNQSWSFVFDGAGSYTIKNNSSNLYLQDIGGKLVQMTKANSAAQLWSLELVSGGFLIKNRATNKVVDDCAQSLKQGNGMITYTSNGGLNQTWSIR
jgi:ricin-type beta-trefoil lectin protein/putative glycosyl hydrolase-like family 15 (GHL15) protein